MGVFALGLELDDIQSSNTGKISFQACYHELFEPDSLGQLLLAINGIIPIRWLPLAANRRFIQASKTIRRQLRDVIQDRIRAVGANKAAGKGDSEEKAKDLLTFMVAEKYYADSSWWTENEIMDQVGGES